MKPFWIALLAISILLAACASPATPAPVPTVAPTAAPSGVTASALVVPAQSAEIAFLTPGAVKEILVKEGDQVAAGQPLTTVDSPALLGALNAAEAALHAAEFDYAYWIPPRLKRPPERKQLALDTLTQAQKAFAVAETEFAQTTLAAPFDATIADLRVSTGEFIQPGQVVLVLANLDQFVIETTDLSESDAPRVKVGQSAKVYIEALDTEFSATVIAISPLGKMVGGDVVYKVTLTLNDSPDGLLWGMTAEVEIVTE